MKEFLITKTMTAQLVVRCDDELQAQKWAGKIVATLEDEHGKTVEPSSEIDFDASTTPAQCSVELVG
jgi:hypothetical protein